MQSLEEKRAFIDSLAVKIGYHTDIELNDDQTNLVWGLIDFGYREDLVIIGKCSLRASFDFDINVWEKKIDSDMAELSSILDGYKAFGWLKRKFKTCLKK